MALIVEDGTGVVDANTYSTVAEFSTYHSERGNDIQSLDVTAIERILIRATDHIEQVWGMRFKGGREFDLQPLSFPRRNLYDFDGDLVKSIPSKLKWAQAEYALILDSQGLYYPLGDRTGEKIFERVVIGPIEVEDRYQAPATTSGVKEYPSADRWLQEYVFPGGRVERA